MGRGAAHRARAARAGGVRRTKRCSPRSSRADRASPCRRCDGGAAGPRRRRANVISERCPFCDQSVVREAAGSLRSPDGVLPFVLDEARARAEVVRWEQELWFKPGPLFARGAPERLRAVYLPYWSFDWDRTDYVGRTSGSRPVEERGSVATRLQGSTVLASASVPVSMGADLEPWDIDRITAPNPQIVQGVSAETHGERDNLARGAALSHRILEREVEHAVLEEIGDPRGAIERRSITDRAVGFRLLLLPVWTTSYAHEGRSRRVLVNGCTGEVIGERPVSLARVGLAVALRPAVPLLAAIVRGASAGSRGGSAALAAFWLALCRAVDRGAARKG